MADAAWTPPASDALWTPPAEDAVQDAAPAAPAQTGADLPGADTLEKWRIHHFGKDYKNYGSNFQAPSKYSEPNQYYPSKEQLDQFEQSPVGGHSVADVASAVPRAAAGYAAMLPAAGAAALAYTPTVLGGRAPDMSGPPKEK